jgi:hypothetical protein
MNYMAEYERLYQAAMLRLTKDSSDRYRMGFESGLKTNWRWRLYFWLIEKFS